MEKMYTAQEVADYLKIKKTTVYELIKRGELSSVKIGKQFRISQAQLDQYTNAIPSSFGASAPLPPTGQPETEFSDSVLKMDYLSNASGLIVGGQDSSVVELIKNQMELTPHPVPLLHSYTNTYNSLYSLYFEKYIWLWPPFPILPICRQYTGRLHRFCPVRPPLFYTSDVTRKGF